MASIITEHVLYDEKTSQCLRAGDLFEQILYGHGTQKKKAGPGIVADITESENCFEPS